MNGAESFVLERGEGGVGTDEANGDGQSPRRRHADAGIEHGEDSADEKAARHVDDERAVRKARSQAVVDPYTEGVSSDGAGKSTDSHP